MKFNNAAIAFILLGSFKMLHAAESDLCRVCMIIPIYFKDISTLF
jgi:hypothetical protein